MHVLLLQSASRDLADIPEEDAQSVSYDRGTRITRLGGHQQVVVPLLAGRKDSKLAGVADDRRYNSPEGEHSRDQWRQCPSDQQLNEYDVTAAGSQYIPRIVIVKLSKPFCSGSASV